MFTRWAPYYDATHAWTLPYRREARLALGAEQGDRVLDVGCGTGLNFAHLRELVGDEGRVTGVDLSPDMLDIARKRIARRGWENVEVYEANAQELPFPDGSFDGAIATFAMMFIPDYARAITEVARVLAPGGRFVVLDFRATNNALLRWLNPMLVRGMRLATAELTHRTIDEMRRVFPKVEVRERWAGFAYIAMASKA